MKILLVSIPSHHFFQWVCQLENFGYDVYWFDVSGTSKKGEKIKWVDQKVDWKIKWDYPGRMYVKKNASIIYSALQKINEKATHVVFKKYLQKIKPDVVHSFAMQLSCIPILKTMQKYKDVKWIYSSWGSDIFLYQNLGVTTAQFKETLQRVDYLITDCYRDYQISLKNDFKNIFLGVYMANGGLSINKKAILNLTERNVLLIKGYEDGIGQALKILDAIELLPLSIFNELEIIIYSADVGVKARIENSSYFKNLNVNVVLRGQFISNDKLLEIMGRSIIHIANSISDGLPTSAIEAMGMGAFPIQSNPGKVSEEVITHEKNGYLISDPFDINEIATLLEKALKNFELRESAQQYNIKFVDQKYNRSVLKKQIKNMYESII